MSNFWDQVTQRILRASVLLHGKKATEAQVIADTTVQEKNITYPTDSKLHKKIIQKCVNIADEQNIELRRSYKRTVPKLMKAQHNASHPKRAKKANKARRKLKTIAGALVRELRRKLASEVLNDYESDLCLYEKVLTQKRNDKNKIYSLHEPEVCCISKAKEHRKYEFGQKASVIKTMDGGIIVGAQSFAGNPYDGHTLDKSLKQVESITSNRPAQCYVDRGYRGAKQIKTTEILLPSKGRKNQTAYQKQKLRKKFRKRAGIEPVIGHLKNDFKLKRNFLKGLAGDQINLMLAAAAFNFNKWIKQARLNAHLLHYISNTLNQLFKKLGMILFKELHKPIFQ